MSPTQICARRRRVVLAWGCAIAAGLLLPAAAAAAAAGTVSSNWAGYAALASTGAPAPRSVSGSWRQPAATCTPGRETYSAVWVGLGGFNEGTGALEQIGSNADCTRWGGRCTPPGSSSYPPQQLASSWPCIPAISCPPR